MKRTTLAALAALLALGACGDFNIRDGILAGASYCEDMGGAYHFRTHTPPWKYNKEYRCTSVVNRQCVGTWQATGRYVFVVSDIPFVNYDSEIVTMMHVEVTAGNPKTLAQQLIATEHIGQTDSKSRFFGEIEYPADITFDAPGLSGWEVLWRQEREFEGISYNWYRRDVFLQGDGSRVFHLELYSIDTLDKPEFDAMIGSFRAGASPDGAPDCVCRDEHDPAGGIQDC
jgi:hypothetical protein